MHAYDPRLDSSDVVVRQQAEIEALRTALIASNSDSNGEVERLRRELEAARASHEGQVRNTLAFMKERDHWLQFVSTADQMQFPFDPVR